MQCPYDGDVLVRQIMAQGRQMQIASMQVMKMHQIGLKAFQFLHQRSGAEIAATALEVQQLAQLTAGLPFQGISNAKRIRLRFLGRCSRAIADPALSAVPLHQTGDFQRNAAGAFFPAEGVQLKYPHDGSSPASSFNSASK